MVCLLIVEGLHKIVYPKTLQLIKAKIIENFLCPALPQNYSRWPHIAEPRIQL